MLFVMEGCGGAFFRERRAWVGGGCAEIWGCGVRMGREGYNTYIATKGRMDGLERKDERKDERKKERKKGLFDFFSHIYGIWKL